jgi:hypothetical protein
MRKASRAEFLRFCKEGISSFLFLGILGKTFEVQSKEKVSRAVPDGYSPVAESEPTASALGYHHEAKQTDFARFPSRKNPASKNEYCRHCLQYSKLNDDWGKCNILTNGIVSTGGWCSAWSKKT